MIRLYTSLIVISVVFMVKNIHAQDLDPRAYARVPVKVTGAESSINGFEMDDRQSNSRIGATMVLPVGKRHSVKFAYSRGAIIRSGADFTSISAGWQTTFFGKPSSKTE